MYRDLISKDRTASKRNEAVDSFLLLSIYILPVILILVNISAFVQGGLDSYITPEGGDALNLGVRIPNIDFLRLCLYCLKRKYLLLSFQNF